MFWRSLIIRERVHIDNQSRNLLSIRTLPTHGALTLSTCPDIGIISLSSTWRSDMQILFWSVALILIFRLNINSFTTLVHQSSPDQKLQVHNSWRSHLPHLPARPGFPAFLDNAISFFQWWFLFHLFSTRAPLSLNQLYIKGKARLGWNRFYLQIYRSVIVYLPPEYKRGRSGCEDHLPKDQVSQGRSAVGISF